MTDVSSSSEYAMLDTSVMATPEECFAVAADIARYPEWANGVVDVTILATDEHGRATKAEFRAEAMGRSTRYTLGYDYSQAPNALSWRWLDGDITRKLDGSYTFEPDPEAPGHTRVTYELGVDLAVRLPGFVMRRAESKIMAAALEEFSRRIESTSRA